MVIREVEDVFWEKDGVGISQVEPLIISLTHDGKYNVQKPNSNIRANKKINEIVCKSQSFILMVNIAKKKWSYHTQEYNIYRL